MIPVFSVSRPACDFGLSYSVEFSCIYHTAKGEILALTWLFYLQNVHSCCKTVYTFNSLNIDFWNRQQKLKVFT